MNTEQREFIKTINEKLSSIINNPNIEVIDGDFEINNHLGYGFKHGMVDAKLSGIKTLKFIIKYRESE